MSVCMSSCVTRCNVMGYFYHVAITENKTVKGILFLVNETIADL